MEEDISLYVKAKLNFMLKKKNPKKMFFKNLRMYNALHPF